MKLSARLAAGIIFGAVLGFAYGAVSQYINIIFLPGVPLLQPWPSGLMGVVIITLVGALTGYMVSYPEDSIPGVLLGGLVVALLTSLKAANDAGWFGGALMVLFVYTLMPRMVLFLPASALLRWVSEQWAGETSRTLSIRNRNLLTAGSILLAVAAGAVSLFPGEVRAAMRDMNALVQAGMQAQNTSAVPNPLRAVWGFPQEASGAYTLEWNTNPELLPAQRPATSFDTLEPFLIVRFENGFSFGCVYTPPHKEPSCANY